MKLTDIIIESVRFGMREKKIVDKMANDIKIGFEFEWHTRGGEEAGVDIKEVTQHIVNNILDPLRYDCSVESNYNGIIEELKDVYKNGDWDDAIELLEEIQEDGCFVSIATTFNTIQEYIDLPSLKMLKILTEGEAYELVSDIMEGGKPDLSKYDTIPFNRVAEEFKSHIYRYVSDIVLNDYNEYDTDSLLQHYFNIVTVELISEFKGDGKSEHAGRFILETGINGNISVEKDDIVEVATVPYQFHEALDVLSRGLGYLKENYEKPTSEDTGLHVNLSIRNERFNKNDINAIKLMFLLPDRYIEKYFPNREYVKSNIRKLKYELGKSYDFWIEFFKKDNKVRQIEVFEYYANYLLPQIEKYRRFNMAYLEYDYEIDTNRIEFRFPGGKGYENMYNEIEQFIYMMAYMTLLSFSDKAGRKEYIQEIYKFLDKTAKDTFGVGLSAVYKFYRKNKTLPPKSPKYEE